LFNAFDFISNRRSFRTLIIIFSLNQDYVIEFLRPDKVRGDACPFFMRSVAIARKSGCLEILA
jgi:hypothetical protein